jgi:SAM-dependent methyltransferase
MRFLSRADRQQQTLASFDYQWGYLPQGDAMLSDPWFRENVTAILPEITGIDAAWFAGRRVLDAGCGSGRWTVGLLRLGAEVTAVDFSAAGLAATREAAAGLGRIETLRVNLLDLPTELQARRFDLIYSFGVLHHTGDTFRALRNVAGLVSDGGAIFLYLYGKESWSLRQSWRTNRLRLRLAGLPFERKIAVLRELYPDKDPHQLFDLLSPTINHRLDFATVQRELERLGFTAVTRTVQSGDLFVRAIRPGFPKRSLLRSGLPVPSPLTVRYREIDNLRRQRLAERRWWDLAAERLSAGPERSLPDGIDFAGKKILVICPDSLLPAQAEVTRLSPSSNWIAAAGSLRTREGSPFDPPPAGAETFDLILALGSALSLTGPPNDAIAALGAWLAPGGELVIETLLPEAETFAHRARRLLLRPFAFERQIRWLLHRHPKRGLDGAFAAWSSRRPARLTPDALAAILVGQGFVEMERSVSGRYLRMRAKRSC